MDNVTHALAGVLLADATVAVVGRRGGAPSARFRRTALWLGVAAAELPDLDIAWSGSLLGDARLGYLLHHRGHTHTVLFAVGAALLLWVLALASLRRGGAQAEGGRARDHEGHRALLALALVGTLSHLLLDWTNSYGVHPFWPIDNRWYYGDAVFIVEPWLWVAAIPPLLAGPRRTLGRLLLGGALLAILVATWWLPSVATDVATALTVGALLWYLTVRRLGERSRLALAAGAWCAVEFAGVASSRAAGDAVRAAMAPAIPDDVVLTQAPADPRCVEGIAVARDGATYRVSTATVAPWPRWRAASACPRDIRALRRARDDAHAPDAEPDVIGALGGGLRRPARPSTAQVRWRREWSAPLAELATLARAHCQAAAALRFMRVPVWDMRRDGIVLLSDLRYGFGGGGFADLVLEAKPRACPTGVPPWVPPRRRLIDGSG
jgi:inner membrane protein